MKSALPYAQATTTGARALDEMHKIVRAFGGTKFGSMVDDVAGTLTVQFEHRGRAVSVTASAKGYAAALVKKQGSQTMAAHKRALEVANRAVYSILRDWIKGQVAAIESGVLTFEGAFLGQILLSSGKTVLEHVSEAKVLPQLEASR